jgi:hypothetical protein
MRITGAGLLAAATVLFMQTGSANAGAWCVYYDAYTHNCGFQTIEQCQATILADHSAYCSPNYTESAPPDRARPRRR